MAYDSEPTSVLRIRITVVNELDGIVYKVFLETISAGRLSRHATLKYLMKHKVGIARLAFNARAAWTVSN